MKLSKLVAIGCLMTAGNTVQAQLVSCNAFLQGNHAEVGINWMGAYGSTVDAPTGYHPHLTSPQTLHNSTACGGMATPAANGLGFVADPNLTNWTAYFGDYYLPGSPQEGWALEINGNRLEAYTTKAQSLDSIAGLSGANVSYTTTPTGVSSTWEGIFDSMKVTQVTSLDTGALFFTVNVTLTNLSAFPRDSVYYLRTIDPDNEVTVTGSFTTSNHIDHQMPGGPDSLVSVSALGTTYRNSQMALATKDHRATAFIIDAGLVPDVSANLSGLYSRATSHLYTLGDSSVSDVGIGLIYNIGHLASIDSAGDSVLRTSTPRHPANSSSMKFIYAFQAGLVGSFLTDTTHHVPLATSNIGQAIETQIRLFPNPSNGNFQLAGLVHGESVALYDLTGRDVTSGITISSANNVTILSNVPQGSYILVVKRADGSVGFRQRVIKN